MTRHASGLFAPARRTASAFQLARAVCVGRVFPSGRRLGLQLTLFVSIALAAWPSPARAQDEVRPSASEPDTSPEPEKDAASPSDAQRDADADAEAARQARIRKLVVAIREDQAVLMALVTEPRPVAQVEGTAEVAEREDARVLPLPLREEVRVIARRLPELQRELHELGGESALLDSPAVWR
jgi:hypothetical protein